MNDVEKREAIEIWKMTKKFINEEKVEFTLEVGDDYKTIKEFYFKDHLGIDDSVVMSIELPAEVVDTFYQMADDRDITIDELVMEILEEKLDGMEEPENGCNYGCVMEF